MGTITSNGTGGGVWSAGASWVGGAAPGNNDTAVIAAGDTIIVDSDFSAAWADGIAGITITSHATTPGMLTFKTSDAGTYSIKVKTGTKIQGTSATTKGRLLANSNGTWGGTTALPFDRKAIIDLAGTAQIDAGNLNIQMYCTEPSTKSVRVYKTLYTVSSINAGTNVLTMTAPHGMAANTAVCVKSSGDLPGGLTAGRCYYVGSPSGADLKLLGYSSGPEIDITSEGTGTIQLYDGHTATDTGTVNVLEDVRAVTGWTTTDGHDYVALVDANAPEAVDWQLLQLTTINETSLVLSGNVDSAQYPDARVFLVSRNVSIRSANTAFSGILVNPANSVLNCEIRGAGGSIIGIQGNGGTGLTMSGVICNCGTGIYDWRYPADISGLIVGCTNAFMVGYNPTMSGTIAGCGSGLYNSGYYTVTGTIMGCTIGINTMYACSIGGTISGCREALADSPNNNVTAVLSGCATGLLRCYDTALSGTVKGCSAGISGGSGLINGSMLSENVTDITFSKGSWVGWGVTSGGTTQVGSYKHASYGAYENRQGVAIQDLGGSHGYIGAWCLGGYTKSAAYAVGTHGSPPVASSIIHETTFEDNDRNTWVEFAVPGTTGNPVTVTFYGKLTGTSAWTTRPSIGIYDPTKGWLAAGEELNASAAMAESTDWQTLTATYEPTWDRELRIRMQGKGGNAGGTGSEKLYWFIVVDLGGGSGTSAVSISPMRGWS